MKTARLRVLSYNIHKGFAVFNRSFTLHKIKEAIRQTGADICFLQEVVGEHEEHRTKITDWPTESQFEFLADSIWEHHSYGKNAVFPSRHHGNAVLSKYPIVRTHNLDLSTNRFEQRGLLHCVVHLPDLGVEIDLLNTHLNLMHGSRQMQVLKIVEWAQKHLRPLSPTILAGDFNDWGQKLTPMFEQGLNFREAFHHRHGRHAKTFPALMPLMCLDRIYFRSFDQHSECVLTDEPWKSISDHLPLLVEFDLTVSS